MKDKEFNKKLVSLVLPIAFQQFMLALVSASDAVMLGRLSQNSMSAVSLASQISFVENLFLAAMTIGLSMLAAQYWGKGDFISVRQIFAYVLKLTAVVCFFFFIITLLFPSALMHIFTSETSLITDGARYLRTVSFSYMLTGISQIYLCMLKNCGKATLSGKITCTGVLLNIGLNAMLIFGLCGFPHMGVTGAALATVITRLVEIVWCTCAVQKAETIRLSSTCLLHDNELLKKDFWKYTTPVLGNEIVWGVGFTMYSVIMGHLGSDAVAANSIANIAKNLVICFCVGLGSGGGIIVGNVLGTGNTKKAKLYGKKLCRLAVLFGALTGLLLLLLTPWIVRISALTPTAAQYLYGMLLMCTYYVIGKSVNTTTIAGIFCAGGDSKFGLVCDAVTMWCITVPLGFLSAFVLHVPVLAVYFVITLDEIVKLPAVYKHYKKYLWAKNITQ